MLPITDLFTPETTFYLRAMLFSALIASIVSFVVSQWAGPGESSDA